MHRFRALLVTLTCSLAFACGDREQASPATQTEPVTTATASPASDKKVVLYSGRNEKLIGPLLQQFTQQSGIQVEARYGETAEMAATLLEEGKETPAGVFLSQDAGALGAVAKAGITRTLPEDVTSRIPARFVGPQWTWAGVSGRARTIVYNPSKIRTGQLPQSLQDVASRRYRDRWGIAPLNASFQAQMAVYHALNGPEALDALLKAMADAQPRRYPRNSAIVDAVAAGEIDFGLVNHYYAWEAKKERPDLPVENYFMPSGDASSFVNVAGVALLDDDPDALALIRYLVSDEAQRYFATQTFEYPLVSTVEPPVALQPLDELRTPEIDYARVSEVLPETLAKINASGLSRN
ncbi:MAG TPA: extracellular solute-binding protein [Thermoanaerobaculia bacterium]|nr:extracellular solute-binding protein [Thermoanaerobaculia bacterium]